QLDQDIDSPKRILLLRPRLDPNVPVRGNAALGQADAPAGANSASEKKEFSQDKSSQVDMSQDANNVDSGSSSVYKSQYLRDQKPQWYDKQFGSPVLVPGSDPNQVSNLGGAGP